jgi:hypothetical protein
MNIEFGLLNDHFIYTFSLFRLFTIFMVGFRIAALVRGSMMHGGVRDPLYCTLPRFRCLTSEQGRGIGACVGKIKEGREISLNHEPFYYCTASESECNESDFCNCFI